MPVVGVNRNQLFEALGRTYSKRSIPSSCLHNRAPHVL